MCDVHVDSDESAILAWHGRTWVFRWDFNALGVPLSEGEGRFRLLPDANRLLCQQENVDLVRMSSKMLS